MSSHPDTERLRRLFTDAACDITPSPVPLAAIEKAGRRRRRRRTTAVAGACGLLLIPLAAIAVHLATPSSRTTVRPAAAAPSPRVVQPGERLQLGPGVQLWLTKEGTHWSVTGQAKRFHVVGDGDLHVTRRPSVSLQAERVQGRYSMSGVYTGNEEAAGVKVVTDRGTVTGSVIRLAGQPGWSAWFASSPLPADPRSRDTKHPREFVRSVTITNAAGHAIATLNLR
ncbi:hypothetical protein ACZ90_50270 [Streptomyces albus subsp. albus]|nr:hypothetical protein ACZ90_50270 [Streptomyces albus subsp. albus]